MRFGLDVLLVEEEAVVRSYLWLQLDGQRFERDWHGVDQCGGCDLDVGQGPLESDGVDAEPIQVEDVGGQSQQHSPIGVPEFNARRLGIIFIFVQCFKCPRKNEDRIFLPSQWFG